MNAPQYKQTPASVILSRLDKVRSSGKGRWMACCPAHKDKTPSLSVREESDGRILLHCFSGCHVESIVAAAGLEMSDLYPDTQKQDRYAPISTWKRGQLEQLLMAQRFEYYTLINAGEDYSEVLARIRKIERLLGIGGGDE